MTTTPEAVPAVHLFVNELTLTRVRQGLTQEHVASMLGVTRQAVSEWESSAGRVRMSTLVSWAGALGLRLELTAGAAPPLLRTDDGAPAQPKMRTHVLLTGPARTEVLPALLREHPGDVVAAPGTDAPGTTIPELSVMTSLLAGHATRLLRSSAGVLVVDLDHLPEADGPALREVLGRARATDWAVIALAADEKSVPPDVLQNLGSSLVAASLDHIAATDPYGRPVGVWHVS